MRRRPITIRFPRLGASLVVCATLGATIVASTPGPAIAAPSGTPISDLSGYYAMFVGPDGRTFISEGLAGSRVAIMNPDATQDGTLTNIPGASGLTVVGTTLYVSAFGASRIDRFDLTTDPPTKLTSFSTLPLASPKDLAYAGGRLWFTTKCDQWGSQLASMTLEGSDVQEAPIPNGDTYCTKLEWSRWAPDRIFIHNTGVSPQHLSELDVSSGSAVPVVTDPWDWGSYNGAPISVTPDGLELLVSFGTGLASFDIDDMTGPTFTYDGWAVASDTTDAGGGLVAATYDTSVRLWQLGQFERLSNYALGASARGVAFSSDGSSLYAVAGGSSTMYFTRIDRPSRRPR